MKKFFILLAVLAVSGCATAKTVPPLTVSKSYQATSSPAINITNKIFMKLTSPDFFNSGFLPPDISCQGAGRAPLLAIANAPTSTVSFALIMNDPDAAIGVFTHWVMWNIKATTTAIDAQKLPPGTMVGANSAGTNKYYPACPSVGLHHYYFRLYALDKDLDLPAKSGQKELLKAMAGHILAEAVLMGQYEKK